MNKRVRLADELKQDALAQVVECGHSVSEVAKRLGISTKSLYTWKAQLSKSPQVRSELAEHAVEIRRRTHLTRNAARQGVFNYIEICYNLTRKHTNNGLLSPVDYKMKQQNMNKVGV